MQGIRYVLTGGMAREILLHFGHDCPPGRATTDLDFGVILPDWDAYERLRAVLTATICAIRLAVEHGWYTKQSG